MPITYQLLCLNALAQPIAVDHVLRLIKKRILIIMFQFVGLMASIFGR